MAENNLDRTYGEIQKTFGNTDHRGTPRVPHPNNVANRLYNSSNPKRLAYRNQVVRECDRFKEGCMKRLLLDIYMQVLPFDDGYVDDNRKICQGDIDAFLTDKKQTAGQYFQSAYGETKAPLLEYVIRSVDALGKQFMEEAEEKADEAEKAGVDVPAPEIEEEEIDNQIVDIKGDLEYEDFIDKLKRKTVKKIVADISALITDKKEEKEMTFSPQTEGASNFVAAMDYLTESVMKVSPDSQVENDDMIALAIRESTLNTVDEVFRQPGSNLRLFTSKLRLGKGIVIHEAAINYLTEGSCEEARSLTPDERATADKRFGKVGCSIMHCDNGYFAKTHRARTKCYPTLEELPKDKVAFVSSTS